MRRILLPVIIGLAACGNGSDGPESGGPSGRTPTIDDPPALATTGAPRIRAMRQDLFGELERMERDLEEGKKPEQRLVDGLKAGIRNLTLATERAIAEEARKTVEHQLATLRLRQGELQKRRTDLNDGIREVSIMIDEIRRGVGRPPEGFTEDELKDRLGELQEQARALDKEDEELRAEMTRREELLAAETVPPQGETLFTHEREAIEELNARVKALEDRLK